MRTLSRFSFIFFVPTILGGCESKHEAASSAASSASAVAAAPSAASAAPTAKVLIATQSSAVGAGALTLRRDQLEEAKKSVKPFMPFKDASKTLFGALGPPHGKTGEDGIFWRALEGSSCTKLEVSKKGDEVGGVSLTSADKAMADAYDRCSK